MNWECERSSPTWSIGCVSPAHRCWNGSPTVNGRRGKEMARTWRVFCEPWAWVSEGLSSLSLTALSGDYQWTSASFCGSVVVGSTIF